MNTASMNGRTIDVNKGTLDDLLAQVVDDVAYATSVDPCAILGRSRKRKIQQARNMVYRALWALDVSQSDIGRLMDRDHSTVNYAVRR